MFWQDLKSKSRESVAHLHRDATAGFITGCMAIPLSAGIAIMSDFPIVIGLATVVFACLVGFLVSLFRPGNYVGTPGIAAGLAPALAYGVQEFGMQNMPFLVFLTACIQMFIWKFNWQKHILLIVPAYLVEGLLAGIGLKIALKFFPFLYTIAHPSDAWWNPDQVQLLVLSFVSFALFLYLFIKFSKKSPGIAYFTVMTLGFVSMILMELPKLSLEPIRIEFFLPFPHPAFFHTDATTGILRMMGYAMMLGSIDIIEQVMSNAAIEKLDPLKRHCHTNNSLLAIWIANLGSSFFGGMTNLDGLAKSSTNAYAGAVTKLSNIFTGLVVLSFLIFPSLLSYLPQYTLGIIMVFTGAKMILGLKSVVEHHGKYAISLAIFCGLLVFKLGIFEGLLICLFVHALLHVLIGFSRRQSLMEIVIAAKQSYSEKIKLETSKH